MATLKNNPHLDQKLEQLVNEFHQQLASEGYDLKISKLTFIGNGNPLTCKCGTVKVIDSVTGQVIGTRCTRCPRGS